MKELTMDLTTVQVGNEQGKTVVSVTTEDADIFINGVCVWSKYDKPEYLAIPAILRPFVESRCSFIKKEKDIVSADLNERGKDVQATLYIPANLRKKLVVRMDFITSLQDLEFEYLRNHSSIDEDTANALVAEFKSLFEQIENEVTSAGYRFVFSHDMGEFIWGWWDVVFSLKDWDEQKFLAIWDKIEHFHNRFDEVLKQYDY